MVQPPVRQGIILRQYGYVHHQRVEGNVVAESRELPLDGLQFVGVSGCDKITDNRGHYLGLIGVWYNVIK